jgi:hypothetical protein
VSDKTELNQDELGLLLSSWLHETGNHLHALGGWLDLFDKKALKNGELNQKYIERLQSLAIKLESSLGALKEFSEVLSVSSGESNLTSKKRVEALELLTRKLRKEINSTELPEKLESDEEFIDWLKIRTKKYYEQKNSNS